METVDSATLTATVAVASSAGMVTVCVPALATMAEKLSFVLSIIWAVSYTHLDVYKRQVLPYLPNQGYPIPRFASKGRPAESILHLSLIHI